MPLHVIHRLAKTKEQEELVKNVTIQARNIIIIKNISWRLRLPSLPRNIITVEAQLKVLRRKLPRIGWAGVVSCPPIHWRLRVLPRLT